VSAVSPIEWTDRTWNPTRGCSRVSPGCERCYAERQALRFAGKGGPYEGLVRLGKKGAMWTGKMRFVRSALAEPLRWRTPCRVFVDSMSDLFHDGVSNEQIAAVFGVMAASRHTFQILTKRARRMREWFDWYEGTSGAGASAYAAALTAIQDLDMRERGPLARLHEVADRSDSWPWPLENVWLGVSAEDQERADERIPELLATPAAVRFVSYEPALGPVDFHSFVRAGRFAQGSRIDWVIIGGESGPSARPFDIAWARSVVRQCKAESVACFVKQLGANPVFSSKDLEFWTREADLGRKGGDPSRWPKDLRVRQMPDEGG